tara:strand:+ start:6238 stop:7251 length:1014 start_codon:yes stop_codon:yes gene_type:complete
MPFTNIGAIVACVAMVCTVVIFISASNEIVVDLPLLPWHSKVQIITCGTKRVAPHLQQVLNVCANKQWKGFGWKMKQFLKYAQTQPDDTILLLIDAKDTFVNRNELVNQIQMKFDSFDADVVFSSDEICRREACLNVHRKQLLLKQLPHSISAFANSAMAGRAWALRQVLTIMLAPDWSDLKDDQIAAIDMFGATSKMTLARVALDTNQHLFGSFAHVKPMHLSHSKQFIAVATHEIVQKKNNYICTDGSGNLFYNCTRVSIVARDRNSVTLIDNVQYTIDPATCSVNRIGSMLATDPIVWHGNWLGRQAFNVVGARRRNCLNNLKQAGPRARLTRY